MIKEAIDRIFSMGVQSVDPNLKVLKVDDRHYTTEVLTSLQEPIPTGISVLTLSGLIDLVRRQIEGFKADAVLLHVVNHSTVELKEITSDKWGRRKVYATAKVPEYSGFRFGEYHAHEDFMISLQAGFVPTDDSEYLIKIAASLTAEVVTNSEDNGIAQNVGLRRGVVLKSTETLKSRVLLAPFRTFREVDQPKSEFVFRVKQNGSEIPKLGLFEADGGKWKVDAIANVAQYLETQLTGLPDGCDKIAVIS